MKKLLACVTVLLMAFGAAGCQERGDSSQRSLSSGDQGTQSKEVIAQSPSLAVSHSIEGDTVYLSFLTRNFSYTPEGVRAPNRQGEGHINVWVDGKKSSVYEGKKEIPALVPGVHRFAVELAQNSNKPYSGTKIEFEITVK
ncbi:hypothetical protein [Aneurinibacillus tyrosinisolvens]|uniref:hypothetical protein n=1 Tax=Aneurinibacillus tyrosinisolvens TaxID=1443435 RepID=UPI00069AC993|nr:hypothetical protein [Aneurinibacillus tyrosinisolvens]